MGLFTEKNVGYVKIVPMLEVVAVCTVLVLEPLESCFARAQDNSYWGCNSSLNAQMMTTVVPIDAGQLAYPMARHHVHHPLSMNRSSIQYILSSYLMGKEQAAALYIAPDDCTNLTKPGGSCSCPANWRGTILDYPEFRAPVGHALGPMRKVANTTGGAVWLREFSNATVAINTSPGVLDAQDVTRVPVPLDVGQRYVDLWGAPIPEHFRLELPPVGAVVLLKVPS